MCSNLSCVLSLPAILLNAFLILRSSLVLEKLFTHTTPWMTHLFLLNKSLFFTGGFIGKWHHAGSLGVLIRTVHTAALPSPRYSLMAGAYQTHQLDYSFSLEPGRPGEDDVAYSRFQHCLVVAGSVLHLIEILQEKVSFPNVKPTQVHPASYLPKKARNIHFQFQSVTQWNTKWPFINNATTPSWDPGQR